MRTPMCILKEKIKELLRRTEPYMKTDMLYLAKGGFWLSFGQVLSLAAGLLLVVGFANLLPKEVYGHYKFILSLAGIIGAFTLTGMGTAVTQAVARGRDGAFRTGVRVQLKWSLLMTVAALGGAAYYFVNGNRTIALSLLIVGALSPVIEGASLYGSYLNGKRDFRKSAQYNVSRSVVTTAVLLATIFLTQHVVVIVLAYFLSHAVITAALYFRVLDKYEPSNEDDHSNIAFSKHLSLTNILSIIAVNIDKVLVFHYLGAVQLAVYGIAYSLPAQMKIVSKILNALMLPKMSAVSLSAIRSGIRAKAVRLFAGFGLMIALYIVAAPLIFRLLFPQYTEAIFISQTLALGFVFSPALLYSKTFFALKRQREIYIFKISTSGIRILLLLVLLPLFGIWGAVYAFFLVNGVSFVISLVLFRRLKA